MISKNLGTDYYYCHILDLPILQKKIAIILILLPNVLFFMVQIRFAKVNNLRCRRQILVKFDYLIKKVGFVV